MIPANMMDTAPMHIKAVPVDMNDEMTITLDFTDMPVFEIKSAYRGSVPPQSIRLQSDEHGSIFHERKPKMVSTVSYMEQSNASQKWLNDWASLIKNHQKKLKIFSVSSHRRGATLTYHTGMANIELEFRSQRIARVYGKRYKLNISIG